VDTQKKRTILGSFKAIMIELSLERIPTLEFPSLPAQYIQVISEMGEPERKSFPKKKRGKKYLLRIWMSCNLSWTTKERPSNKEKTQTQ